MSISPIGMIFQVVFSQVLAILIPVHWVFPSGGTAGFSLGLDDMEGDLSPPIWGGTSTGGQSSNRGGRMGRDIYFMGGDPYFE